MRQFLKNINNGYGVKLPIHLRRVVSFSDVSRNGSGRSTRYWAQIQHHTPVLVIEGVLDTAPLPVHRFDRLHTSLDVPPLRRAPVPKAVWHLDCLLYSKNVRKRLEKIKIKNQTRAGGLSAEAPH